MQFNVKVKNVILFRYFVLEVVFKTKQNKKPFSFRHVVLDPEEEEKKCFLTSNGFVVLST